MKKNKDEFTIYKSLKKECKNKNIFIKLIIILKYILIIICFFPIALFLYISEYRKIKKLSKEN
jgi:hypothetical protein